MEKKNEEKYDEPLKRIDQAEENELIKYVKSWSSISAQKNKDILFCIYLIIWIESLLKEVLEKTLLDSQKPELKYPKFINLIFQETTFNSKINIMEGIFKGTKRYKDFKAFFSYCRGINNTRNQIFHIKLENLTYCGMPVSDIKTKRKMLKGLIEARKKMNIP